MIDDILLKSKVAYEKKDNKKIKEISNETQQILLPVIYDQISEQIWKSYLFM